MNSENVVNDAIQKKERILSLDVIRGIAILGILLMNIQSFSMIGQAYENPTAFGDLTGINKLVWMFSHIFADQKFMSIFSMLFGASIFMIAQSAENKFGTSFGIHYRRNIWLLIIGLIHAYLFWYGDILTFYAVCALLLYPLRKLSVKNLIVVGILLIATASFIDILHGIEVSSWSHEQIKNVINGWNPHKRVVDYQVNAYLGDWNSQFEQRAGTAYMLHFEYFPFFYFWRISGLMLLGIALFKTGFLSAKLSLQVYKKLFFITSAIGFPLVIYGVYKNFNANWSITYSDTFGAQFNYWGSILIAISYLSMFNIIVKQNYFEKLLSRFAAIGKMALSNYLFQTLLCTSIFYGFGFGLFGQVERSIQLLIVFVVWFIQLIISPIWMKYFNFGPIEWLWRGLTNLKFQKLSK